MKNPQESVTAAIFNKDRNKILLIKRRDVPVWVLPGGGIEQRESPSDAALREASEETGYSFTIVRQIGKYFPINKLTTVTYLYELKILEGQAKIGSETKDIRFFDLKELPKLIPPPYDEWIQESRENQSLLIQRPLSSVTYFRLFKNLILHPMLVIRFLLARIGLRINT